MLKFILILILYATCHCTLSYGLLVLSSSSSSSSAAAKAPVSGTFETGSTGTIKYVENGALLGRGEPETVSSDVNGGINGLDSSSGDPNSSVVVRDDGKVVLQNSCDKLEELSLNQKGGAIMGKRLATVSASRSMVEYTSGGGGLIEPGMVIHGTVNSYSLIRKIDQFAFSGEASFRSRFKSESSFDDDNTELLQFDGKYLPDGDFKNRYAVVSSPSNDPRFTYEVALFYDYMHQGEWNKCAFHPSSHSPINSGFEKYRLEKQFGRGGQGEVWQAVKLHNLTDSTKQNSSFFEQPETYVLKRVFVERGQTYLLSGLREKVFGTRLQNRIEIARFVEWFNHTVKSEGKNGEMEEIRDLWLVFQHEGQSLDAMLYSRVEAKQSILVEPSDLWNRMRRDSLGAQVRREVIKQILEGLVVLDKNNIAHRDVKPSNILLSQVKSTKRKKMFQVKLSDFGSAVDTKDSLLNHELYGDQGPTKDEETRWYRPPEAFLAGVTSKRFPYLGNDHNGVERLSMDLPYHAYDMWSVGVVCLEMLLGTAQVFELEARSRARIDMELNKIQYLQQNKEAMENFREMRYNLKALEAFGIYPDPSKSSKIKFNETITKRDPFKRGFYFEGKGSFRNREEMKIFGDNELDFVWSLLNYSPFERPTAAQALKHPYFM